MRRQEVERTAALHSAQLSTATEDLAAAMEKAVAAEEATVELSLSLTMLSEELRKAETTGQRAGVLEDEIASLKTELKELNERMAVLPEFYQRAIFCAEETPKDLIDALAPETGSGIRGGLEELGEAGVSLAEAHLGNIASVVSSRFGRWFTSNDEDDDGNGAEYTAEQVIHDIRGESGAAPQTPGNARSSTPGDASQRPQGPGPGPG